VCTCAYACVCNVHLTQWDSHSLCRVVRCTLLSSMQRQQVCVVAAYIIIRRCHIYVLLSSYTWSQIGQGYPLNLSISVSGGKETNKDSRSNGE
jgi:hypothetical protein